MPKYLYSLPNPLIILVCIIIISLIAHLAPTAVSSMHYINPSENSMKIAQLLFGLLGSTVGMFIGFLLNQAQSNFQSASALVATEASHINSLDRLLLRFGDLPSVQIRGQLRKYLESIIKLEWQQMKNDKACSQTHLLWRSISQSLFKLEPASPKQIAIYSDILDRAEQVAESREVRIDRSAQKLPTIFWFAILLIFLGISSITSLVVPGSEISFAMKIFPVIFGSLLGLLIIFDQPFKGKTSVKVSALQKVLDSIETRMQ